MTYNIIITIITITITIVCTKWIIEELPLLKKHIRPRTEDISNIIVCFEKLSRNLPRSGSRAQKYIVCHRNIVLSFVLSSHIINLTN